MASDAFVRRVRAFFSGPRYRLIIVCSAISLPLIELFLPRLSPTRFWSEGVYKLLYLVPLSLCWWAGVTNRWTITVRTRQWAGFVQSLALVYLVYAEYQTRSYRSVLGISGESPPWVITIFWIGIVVMYTTLYATTTRFLRKRIVDGRHSAERP